MEPDSGRRCKTGSHAREREEETIERQEVICVSHRHLYALFPPGSISDNDFQPKHSSLISLVLSVCREFMHDALTTPLQWIGSMVSTVYWPTYGIRQDRGRVVGWRIEDVAVVVGIVDEWVRLLSIETTSMSKTHNQMSAKIAKAQHLDLEVIGIAGGNNESTNTELRLEVEKRQLKRCSCVYSVSSH